MTQHRYVIKAWQTARRDPTRGTPDAWTATVIDQETGLMVYETSQPFEQDARIACGLWIERQAKRPVRKAPKRGWRPL